MQSHTNKNTAPEHKAIAHEHSQAQLPGEGMHITDNRPKTIAHRKLQEIADNSKQVKQLKALQATANRFVTTRSPVQKKSEEANSIKKISKPAICSKVNNPVLQLSKKTTPQQQSTASQSQQVLSGAAAASSHPQQQNQQPISGAVSANSHAQQQSKALRNQQVLSGSPAAASSHSQQLTGAASANYHAQQQSNAPPNQQGLPGAAAAASSHSQQQNQQPQSGSTIQPTNYPLTVTQSQDVTTITAVVSSETTTIVHITIPSSGYSPQILSSFSDKKSELANHIENLKLLFSQLNSAGKNNRQKYRQKINAKLEDIKNINLHVNKVIQDENDKKRHQLALAELDQFHAYLLKQKVNHNLVNEIILAIKNDSDKTTHNFPLKEIEELQEIWNKSRSTEYITNIHSPGNPAKEKQRGRDNMGNVMIEITANFILILNGRKYNIHVSPK